MGTPPGTRPALFIGCATESLDVAYAIQENLDRYFEVTVWDQDVFELNKTSLESLIRHSRSTDAAVLVFTPEDMAELRDTKVAVARDNVVFELGLFLGRLGRERTFVVLPRHKRDFHLPSDLDGVTPATYDADRSDGNLRAALGPACNQIRKATESAVTGHGSARRLPESRLCPVSWQVMAGHSVLLDDLSMAENTTIRTQWPVRFPFRLSYEFALHKDHPCTMRLRIRPDPQNVPFVECIFPWEHCIRDPDRLECHIDCFEYEGQQDPPRLAERDVVERTGLAKDTLYQVSVSFGQSGIAFASTAFDRGVSQLAAPIDELRRKGLPLTDSCWLEFFVDCPATIRGFTVHEGHAF